jgi:hypothetical protein
MLPILPILTGTSAGLDLLKKAKEWFYPDTTISDAEAIMRKRMADDVGSLQAQIQVHRTVIDKLVVQAKADKEMILRHNEVLIQLSEEAQRAAAKVGQLRILAFWAIGIAGLSVFVAILLVVFSR